MDTLRNKNVGIFISLIAAFFPFYAFFQMTVLNSLANHLTNVLQISHVGLSALSSAYLYGDALMLIPAGILLDKLNTRYLILISFALLFVSSLVFFFSHSFALALCARFFAGAAHGFALISAFRICSILVNEKHQGLVMSLILTIAFLGCLFAQSPFVSLLTYLGYSNTILLQAFLGLIIFLVLFLLVQEPAQAGKATQTLLRTDELLANLKDAIKNKQNWLAMAYIALMGMPFMLFGALYGIEYLTKFKQLSPTEASSVAGWIFVGIILGSPIAGWLFDHCSYRKVLMGGGAFCTLICCIFVFYIQEKLWLLFILIGLFSSTQVLGYPVISSNNSKTTVSTSMGFVNFLIMTTLGSLQLAAGILANAYSLAESLLIMTILSTLISIFCAFILKPEDDKNLLAAN